jgi:prepilin-type N-terminal cleavage/methylation domain-containing protein
MFHRSSLGFTLIELLVVIAIIAILSVVVILTISPAELLRQSRDANRVSDVGTITTALGIFAEDQSAGYLGSSSVIYVSLPDPTATSTAGDQCQGLGLLTLPPLYSYHCAATSTYRNSNGTGWIPVNFSSVSVGSPIGSLPIDPVNTSSSRDYYTYVTNGTQYEVTAAMESAKYKAGGTNDVVSGDGGALATVYEKGSKLGLEPIDYGDPNLVGLWSFAEGSGTTAYDWSGNGNNGTWSGTASGTAGYYSAGKVGSYAGTFNGANNQITLPAILPNSGVCNATISAWSEDTGTGTGSMGGIISGNSSGWDDIEYNDTALRFELRNGINGNSGGFGGSYLNRWILNTLVLSNGSAYGYTNGILIWSGGNIGCIGLTVWNIGYWDTWFKGLIGDVRVYNRALSASEIAAMYSGSK